MSTTTIPNPLKVVCPRCKADIDEFCKSRSGQDTKTFHRPRIAMVGGKVPDTSKKSRTARKARTTQKKVTVRKGINSSTVNDFMNDLESLRDKWVLNGNTTIAVLDQETGEPMTAAFDNGSWLVTMGD